MYPVHGCVHAKSVQSCLTLSDLVDWSPPASLPTGSSRQDHRSGLPCPPPGALPHPGIKPESLTSSTLAASFFTTSAIWKALLYPVKTIILKDICTPVFTAALFTIARKWKQSKRPLTDECILQWLRG